MQLLNTPPSKPEGSIFTRHTARAIVLKGSDILLLFTERYDDYTLPGGGVDENEAIEEALLRELQEETGVKSITQCSAFGRFEEIRAWYKDDFDYVHIVSDCYVCEICGEFDKPQMEHYEVANGMRPVWVNIDEAIAHNKQTLAQSEKKGLSIQREIFLLEKIRFELLDKDC